MKIKQFYCKKHGEIIKADCIKDCIFKGHVCSELQVKYLMNTDWAEKKDEM